MTVTWPTLAQRLAAELAGEGILHSPAWRAALEQTPRHLFVPAFHRQQPDGTWTTTAEGDEGWLEAVYRNEPLVTALATSADGHEVTVSSSTKPGLLARMLETLDVHDGHRVLEIGTGTGYNAGLLCHRLGAARVHSVDIGTDLVAEAPERLATIGHAPVLAAVDGAGGLPGHGPYDRIIATCSVPRSRRRGPPSSAPAVSCSSTSNPPSTPATSSCSSVTRIGSKVASSRRGQGFMAIRSTDTAPTGTHFPVDPSGGTRSRTTLDPLPWNSLIPWFLAQADLPAGITFGYLGAGPEWAVFTASDGSWCTVRMEPGEDRKREVRQSGPTSLGNRVEAATEAWVGLGRPSWDRFGLTVRPGRPHRIWLDSPESDVHWQWLSRPAT